SRERIQRTRGATSPTRGGPGRRKRRSFPRAPRCAPTPASRTSCAPRRRRARNGNEGPLGLADVSLCVCVVGIDPGLGTRFASTSRRSNLVGHRDMTLHRRSFLRLAGVAGAGSAFGICAPAIVRAATPIKLTLPWLPLGTYSFTFAAKKLGYWEKRGLDASIDRGFGSTKVCVPVDQGQYDFGLLDMAVMAGCAGRGLDLVAIA